jgi:putative heme-binding domain-containing protein
MTITRLHILGLAASALACALSATVARGFAAGQGAAAAGQVNREAVLEAHAKDDKGGVAAEGRPLFEKLCAGCHRFGAMGKDVGPDLTTITSRFKKRDILESVLFPSKIISDQYQAEMIELTSGSLITGVLVRENATAILVRTGDNPDKPVAVQKAQIANRAPSTVSLMPEGLIDALSHAEVENMLSFMMAPAPEK